MNFTDIIYDTEIKIIEDNPDSSLSVDKTIHCLGVQINISEPTILYGVDIYGNNVSLEPTDIYIQINGYDEANDAPDENIVHGTPSPLNMTRSIATGWYIQTFLSPIPLSIGNYYLVINGTSIGSSSKKKYNWWYQTNNPNYPNLNVSTYPRISGSWNTSVMNMPFLHKLIQRINTSIYPDEINMTAQVNGVNYNVTRRNNPGTGNLTLDNINFCPNDANLYIKINNNQSKGLIFNLSYQISLNSIFISNGSVLISKNNQYHRWRVTPSINANYNNCSVQFNYSKSWINVTVYGFNGTVWQNVTSNVSIDKTYHTIFIPNKTLANYICWNITARSPNMDINLNVPQTEH